MTKFISVKGAREHNLKNVSIDLPREKLIVFTGPSGSGKSSLAFDTIYAEGQRRYVESLSAYARQFLELMQKPDVDSIEGLSPAISIEQKTTSKNPRSTVGTVTEIYDYMRLLFARIGIPYSPTTGKPISSQSITQMVDQIIALDEGTKLYLLAPIVRDRKGEYRKELTDLRQQGFSRVKIDGAFYELDDLPKLDKKLKHDIDIVIDRIAVRKSDAQRYAQSLETALEKTDGIAICEYADVAKGETSPKRLVFSQRFACPVSGFTITEIEPRLFSFNNPAGACPACDGLGNKLQFEADLIVPNPKLSLRDGALVPWAKSGNSSPYYEQTLESLAGHYKFKTSTAFEKLPKKIQNVILFGSKKEEISFLYSDGKKVYEVARPFEGVLKNIERRWRETDSNWMREELSRYQSSMACPTCNGNRLRPEALAVKIDQKHIGEITQLSIKQALEWFQALPKKLDQKENEIAVRILKEITERLRFLNDVGLDYLNLSRTSGTLSGGESQRIRLASQIGSGLTGVLYVLDEPSIGLHQRDNMRLLETLKHLRDIGNSVIVVEHDEEAIRLADHIVDIGPHAGVHGGQIVAQGTCAQIKANKHSITGQYLSGKKEIAVPKKRRRFAKTNVLKIEGAEANNLKKLTVELPLGVFTAVTGVSGGGKSSFLLETVYKAAARHLMGSRALPGPHKKISGLNKLDKVIDISQSPIGRTPRSNPATYTGAFGPIRDWYTGLPEAKARGYKPGRFSFNVKGGRCETCKGDGLIKIEMHFLPDVYVTCDQCKGKRYNRETLEILYKGKSIADVLDMTVEEGVAFFSPVPSIAHKLQMLQRVGLGYIKIGQQATTLSGGEAQRVKLAKELAKRSTGRTLYILDEPTTGLHFDDIAKLLDVLQELVNQGNTIAVIEHNLDVIKTADWIIDIGPEGGSSGGTLVATGTPEQVSNCKESHTGHYLAPLLTPKLPKTKAKKETKSKAKAS